MDDLFSSLELLYKYVHTVEMYNSGIQKNICGTVAVGLPGVVKDGIGHFSRDRDTDYQLDTHLPIFKKLKLSLNIFLRENTHLTIFTRFKHSRNNFPNIKLSPGILRQMKTLT